MSIPWNLSAKFHGIRSAQEGRVLPHKPREGLGDVTWGSRGHFCGFGCLIPRNLSAEFHGIRVRANFRGIRCVDVVRPQVGTISLHLCCCRASVVPRDALPPYPHPLRDVFLMKEVDECVWQREIQGHQRPDLRCTCMVRCALVPAAPLNRRFHFLNVLFEASCFEYASL